MQQFIQNIKGDRSIWAVVALLALFSFMPVYSASSNLAYLYGDGNTLQFLIKHLAHLTLGFVILFGVSYSLSLFQRTFNDCLAHNDDFTHSDFGPRDNHRGG